MGFGILGTGNIAGQFARGVAGAQRSRVVAVGSRRADSAAAFGGEHGIDAARCHGSYEALLADPAVDAVYISLPNHLHEPWTLRALEAGKHVLCEKPLAMDPGQARRMFDAADAAGRLLMEAFMYRCHPLLERVRDAVDAGEIGGLRTIRASFCYRTSRVDGNVRFDPDIGGGALMDIGCYCLDFCRYIVGRPPVAAHLVGHRHETGVDDLACAILKFNPAPPSPPPPPSPPSPALQEGEAGGGGGQAAPRPWVADGVVAALSFGMSVQLDNTAHLGGSDGHLQIPVPWKPPQHQARYVLGGQTPPKQDLAEGRTGPPAPRTVSVDAPAPLYGLEADRFADALAGRRPLPITPAESLGNADLIAQLRQQV